MFQPVHPQHSPGYAETRQRPLETGGTPLSAPVIDENVVRHREDIIGI